MVVVAGQARGRADAAELPLHQIWAADGDVRISLSDRISHLRRAELGDPPGSVPAPAVSDRLEAAGGRGTHTMVMTCAVAASFWAFMHVVERGRAGHYILFGVFVGLGMISKWSFAAFVMALLGSSMLQPRMRQTIFNWRILLSGAASIIVASPAIYWVVAGHQDLISVYGQAVAPLAPENRFKATLIGLGLSLFAPLAFLFPLDVILLALFPRMVRQAALSIRNAFWLQRAGEVNWERLILNMTIAGFILLMLGALLTGATHYLERYMHPFFLLTTLLLLAMVERIGPSSRRALIFGVVLFTVTGAVLPLRFYDDLHAMG